MHRLSSNSSATSEEYPHTSTQIFSISQWTDNSWWKEPGINRINPKGNEMNNKEVCNKLTILCTGRWINGNILYIYVYMENIKLFIFCIQYIE